MTLHLSLQNVCAAEVPEENTVHQWASACISDDKDYEVCLRIVDKNEIQALNADYRQKDKPTNVLSFPLTDDDMPEEDEIMLGDIIICAAVIEDEAREQNKQLTAHWAHMVIHGMLHLQGYDHINDADAVEMESLETNILNKFGFPDPYA